MSAKAVPLLPLRPNNATIKRVDSHHMRVCLVAYRYYEGNTHMQQFARVLADRGDTVDVIGVRRRGSKASEVIDGVNVWRLAKRPNGFGNRFVYAIRLLYFICRCAVFLGIRQFKHGYDLVHVQTVPDVLVFSALIPKLLGASVILDIRDLTPELYASKLGLDDSASTMDLLRALERGSAAFADHVIVSNPIWHERLVTRAVRREKCAMIWYAPDPRLFYPRVRRRRDNSFLIMYPGTFSRHQGVDTLIRALPRIAAAIPQVALHIYGDGPGKAELIAITEELGLSERVRFFDFLPVRAIVERMAESELAVVPKRASDRFGDEAASTKIPEFMALGVPVVASRTAIESLFFDESEVCYFRSEDEEDLARAVVSVYEDAERCQSLIRNGRKAVEQKAQLLRDEYLGVVDGVLRRNPRRRACEVF